MKITATKRIENGSHTVETSATVDVQGSDPSIHENCQPTRIEVIKETMEALMSGIYAADETED